MTGLALGGDGGTAYGGAGSHWGAASEALTPDRTYLLGRSRADAVDAVVPDVTVGETTTLTLIFDPHRDVPNARGRYQQVRDRLRYANDDAVVTDTTMDGTPWFRESHGHETLLVKAAPGRDLGTYPGFWGVIVGGGDQTVDPRIVARVEVEVFVLAPLETYDTPADVRAVHER